MDLHNIQEQLNNEFVKSDVRIIFWFDDKAEYEDEMIKTTRKLDNFMDWNLLNQNNYDRALRVLGVQRDE